VKIIVYLSRSAMGIPLNLHKGNISLSLVPIYPADKTLAWFDGVSQQQGFLSGAGGVIKLDVHREYRWILNCGKGTNTRAELMGAWATLVLAVRLSVSDLHVLGDSKTIIDRLNRKGDLRVANLDAWKDRIEEIYPEFRSISFEHIFKEANEHADQLSKKALLSCRGRIAYNLWVEGHKGPSQFIYL
jgi:ribonuclease HI